MVHRSAQNCEGIALARVAPRLRRDALAKDAEEYASIRRVSTEHDGGDFEYGEDDALDADALYDDVRKGIPEKPVDALDEEHWRKAWQPRRRAPHEEGATGKQRDRP